MEPKLNWFVEARYGLFVHYGLYSLLGRGEWVLNREAIPPREYAALAQRFTAEHFDADALLRRAKAWGMRYAVLTTKHHEGFCLYDSKLTRFTAPQSAAKRDLVAEFVQACRKHGLKIGLYHSLNDWSAVPNAVDALERPKTCYQPFIDFVHGQIREIMTNYGKIDTMWYDGWWPFDGQGWQAKKMNAMVRRLQPGILINSRCGLKGDFGTPENHIAASRRPWEACLTLNDSWGYNQGDHHWKTPGEVVEMLRKCSAGQGNLLLNIGPRGDGSIPEASLRCLDQAGQWLKQNGEAIFNTERFEFYPCERGDGRSEWTSLGQFTATGQAFCLHVRNWPGSTLTLAGVKCHVRRVTLLATGKTYPFTQVKDRVQVSGLPRAMDTNLPVVIRFQTQGRPMLYLTGGSRKPKGPHCHYDPLPSDILW